MGGPSGGGSGGEVKRMAQELLKEGNAVRCFQCGSCTSACTVNSAAPEYNPRRLIEGILVTNTPPTYEDVWMCATCGLCLERCPREVSAMDIMLAARSLYLAGDGKIPKDRETMIESIVSTGYSVPVKGDIKKIRGELGLPDIRISAEDQAEITEEFERSGLLSLIRHRRGGGDER